MLKGDQVAAVDERMRVVDEISLFDIADRCVVALSNNLDDCTTACVLCDSMLCQRAKNVLV